MLVMFTILFQTRFRIQLNKHSVLVLTIFCSIFQNVSLDSMEQTVPRHVCYLIMEKAVNRSVFVQQKKNVTHQKGAKVSEFDI